MILSIVLCICIILIFLGLAFFMETESGWKYKALFSSDERDQQTAKTAATVVHKGSAVAVVSVPETESAVEEVYENMMDCAILTKAYTVTPTGAAPRCAGYGTCVAVCPNHAITMHKGQAVVGENCNGCGMCVDVCPLHLISLVQPAEETAQKRTFWFNFWKFWYTILKRDEADGSVALWE